jgi:hypothetical protein
MTAGFSWGDLTERGGNCVTQVRWVQLERRGRRVVVGGAARGGGGQLLLNDDHPMGRDKPFP